MVRQIDLLLWITQNNGKVTQKQASEAFKESRWRISDTMHQLINRKVLRVADPSKVRPPPFGRTSKVYILDKNGIGKTKYILEKEFGGTWDLANVLSQ